MRITSNARWSKIPRSKDTHNTLAQAKAVCEMLKEENPEHRPCKVRGFCKESWVEIDGVRQK